MPMIEEKRAILAKIEATYGVDPVPTGAANAILAKNINWRPLDPGYAGREGLALPFLGRFSSRTAIKRGMIEFDVEMGGANGAVDAVPNWGPLMRACGMAQTVNAGVSVAYAPVSAALESVAIFANIDGLQQRLLGCRGSVALVGRNEEIPVFRFRFISLYQLPTDTALPALTLTAWPTPLPMNKTNTTPISLHGYAAGLQEFDIDKANGVQYQSFPGAQGSEQVFITTRAPTGRVVIEHPTMAQQNYFGIVESGAEGVFSLTHGTVAGNRVAIAANQSRLTNPSRGNVRGIVTLNMDLELSPTSAGNNEFTVTTS